MSDVAFAPALNMNALKNGQMAQHGSDNSLLVEFYKESIYMEADSDKAGHPIYKDFDFVHIVLAGGKSEIRRPVKMVAAQNQLPDPQRFPGAWAAFQNQNTEARDGMPLEQCPFLPKAEVMGFKAGRVLTVEQLSGIPDSALQNFGMNARKWRDMAIAYLDRAENNKDITALVAKYENLQSDFELLKKQFLAVSGGAQPDLPEHPVAPVKTMTVSMVGAGGGAGAAGSAPKKRGRKPKPKTQ